MELTPESLLSRDRVAQELTKHGFPIAPGTLRTMATRGNGPTYRRFGRVTVYKWGDAMAWAEARLSEPLGGSNSTE